MQRFFGNSRRAVLLLAIAAALPAGCEHARESTASPATAAQHPANSSAAAVQPVSAELAAANPLDSDRAFGYLEQIVDLGPRPSGSPGMIAQQKLVADHFSQLGGQVSWQRFRMRHPQTGEAVSLANLIVVWYPQRSERILLCVHYDTRPRPDNPRVSVRDRGDVFVGANDGASGVAALMELAHHLPAVEGKYGIDFLLVDAEEFVFDDKRDDYFVGSRYFARQYVAEPPPHRYAYGVVLDMIGDRQLAIYQERNSVAWKDTRPVVNGIWSTAKRLGVHEFIARKKHTVRDDHLMLRNVGKIPTCNVIDFDYPRHPTNRYWHTSADTPDKCSGESLAKVGWVVLEWAKTVE